MLSIPPLSCTEFPSPAFTAASPVKLAEIKLFSETSFPVVVNKSIAYSSSDEIVLF